MILESERAHGQRAACFGLRRAVRGKAQRSLPANAAHVQRSGSVPPRHAVNTVISSRTVWRFRAKVAPTVVSFSSVHDVHDVQPPRGPSSQSSVSVRAAQGPMLSLQRTLYSSRAAAYALAWKCAVPWFQSARNRSSFRCFASAVSCRCH